MTYFKTLDEIEATAKINIKAINKCRLETDYDFLTEDEKLWYSDPLYDYDKVVELIINHIYTEKPRKYDYSKIVDIVNDVNDELSNTNKPLLNAYFVYNSYRKYKNDSIKHKT